LNLAAVAPALLASMAISIAVVLLFIANLFAALGQPAGTPGNERLLQFLSPADVAVAAVITLAIVLVGLAPRAPASPEASTVPIGPAVAPGGLTPSLVRMSAGVVAAVVAVAALIRAITALTISHQPGGIKFGNLLDALAAALVAAVAGWWALRTK
jgi:hypothetical protein